jgi:hypothetical protein
VKAIRRNILNQCRLADDKAGVISGLLLLENRGPRDLAEKFI